MYRFLNTHIYVYIYTDIFDINITKQYQPYPIPLGSAHFWARHGAWRVQHRPSGARGDFRRWLLKYMIQTHTYICISKYIYMHIYTHVIDDNGQIEFNPS